MKESRENHIGERDRSNERRGTETTAVSPCVVLGIVNTGMRKKEKEN